ncbi:Uncharacterized protein dnm_021520 [Desulfonema magnum]|uniref:Uncharacterized protein n=1 Tax=Desulfonema magnum TaxID=45655 RepID=A0A975BIV2_9BACT|nr:Uncharacterized protein dnm_021520 [Desulfonema magnum]
MRLYRSSPLRGFHIRNGIHKKGIISPFLSSSSYTKSL